MQKETNLPLNPNSIKDYLIQFGFKHHSETTSSIEVEENIILNELTTIWVKSANESVELVEVFSEPNKTSLSVYLECTRGENKTEIFTTEQFKKYFKMELRNYKLTSLLI